MVDISATKIKNSSGYVKETLMKSFVPSPSGNAEAETKRFEQIVDTVMRTPIGRQTMARLVQTPELKGLSISFENIKAEEGMVTRGYQLGNKIALNSAVSTEMLTSTFVHEATHALQTKGKIEEIELYTAESTFRKHRAMEADANAKQALFVHQCKQYAPNVWEEHKNRSHCSAVFENAMENGKTEQEALRETFLSWYQQPRIVRAYDQHYAKDIEEIVKWLNKKGYIQHGLFSKTHSNDDIMAFCSYNGSSYIEEEDFSNIFVRSIEVDCRNSVQDMVDSCVKRSERDVSLQMMAPVRSYEDRLKSTEKYKKMHENAERRNRQGQKSPSEVFAHRSFAEDYEVHIDGKQAGLMHNIKQHEGRPSLMATITSHQTPSQQKSEPQIQKMPFKIRDGGMSK